MTDNGKRDDIVGSIGPDSEELAPAVLAAAVALRQPVDAIADFDARVMTAVRSAARGSTPAGTPWWRRRSVRLSPAAAAALAAGIAFVAFLGARSLDSGSTAPVTSAAASAEEATQVVRFVFVAPQAHQVSVVGSFNHWQKDATPLQATGVPGVWAVSVQLEEGMHEYAFLIDGEKWAPDPYAPSVTDEFGTQSSIVRIQGPTSS